ncbi:hypothetical protein [Roseateles sp.]|uniref:hypothetical protein n=1 Tax=Roseateles sp. TaxID=1971397 RepID=UPI003264E91B
MTIDDFKAFCEALDGYWAMKGQAMTAAGRASFFEVLQDHPLLEVRYGLKAHFNDPERGRFLPMPADVVAQIKRVVADDGRPGPEEAWAQAFKALDERATVVWTAEAAEAYAIASPVLQAGDEVGARMAFREAYNRLVAEAREVRAPVRWAATIGDDDELRDRVLLPHVLAGRLSADELKRPELVELSRTGAPAGPALGLDSLLALPTPADASAEAVAAREKARAALAATRAAIQARQSAPTPSAVAAQVDRERVEMLKAESAGKLRDYIETRQLTQTAV